MHPFLTRFIALLFLAALLLSGCGPQPKDCARPDVFCAGLVTDYGLVDSGLNREAWKGLQDAEAAHVVDRVDYIATVDTRDRAANISVLVKDGYDVIVTVGTSMSNQTLAAAADHPKTLFVGVNQPQEKAVKNVAGLVFHEDYGGFLAGVLAVRMTQTKQVAAVCEAEFVDPVRRYCEGFVAGAQYTDPNVRATATYREGPPDKLFNDPEWGHAAALKEVDDGADVIFATGGSTAVAALEAAAAQGAYVIGSETDQYLDVPNVRARLLSSATNDVRPALVELLTLARQGKFPAGEFMGTEKMAPLHDLDRQVPPEVKQELERIYIRLALQVVPLDIPYKKK